LLAISSPSLEKKKETLGKLLEKKLISTPLHQGLGVGERKEQVTDFV
jgi:hypothetical protein